MKTYKAIINEINKNNAIIKELDAAISAEDRNSEKLFELCNEQEQKRIINAILAENFRHVLALAGKKALAEVTAKYDGKPLGEMTDKAIRKEMRKRGFYVYFDRGYSWNNKKVMTIEIETVDGSRVKAELFSPCIEENGERKRDCFVTEENKINYSAIVGADVCGTYCESPAKKAREIKKAYTKYANAVKAAADAQKALNGVMPPTMGYFNNINEYLHGFSYTH